MSRIAQTWFAKYSFKLQYGDISRPGGINTPDHSTHKLGKAFDIRLQRKDNSSSGGFSWSQTSVYNRELTKEFILFVIKLYPGTTFYFNDKEVNEKDMDTRNFVDSSKGHDDHLHVMFPGGRE